MAQVAWRCINAEGDVKYAAREAHVDILEQKGYTCTLDPDAQFDEHDTQFLVFDE